MCSQIIQFIFDQISFQFHTRKKIKVLFLKLSQLQIKQKRQCLLGAGCATGKLMQFFQQRITSRTDFFGKEIIL